MSTQKMGSSKFGSAMKAFEQQSSIPAAFSHTIKDTNKIGTRKWAPKKTYIKPDIDIGTKIVGKDSDLEGFGDTIQKVKKEDVQIPAGAIRKHRMVKQLSGRFSSEDTKSEKQEENEKSFSLKYPRSRNASSNSSSASNFNVKLKPVNRGTEKTKRKKFDIFASLDDAIENDATEEAKVRAAAEKAAANAPIIIPPKLSLKTKKVPEKTKSVSSKDSTESKSSIPAEEEVEKESEKATEPEPTKEEVKPEKENYAFNIEDKTSKSAAILSKVDHAIESKDSAPSRTPMFASAYKPTTGAPAWKTKLKEEAKTSPEPKIEPVPKPEPVSKPEPEAVASKPEPELKHCPKEVPKKVEAPKEAPKVKRRSAREIKAENDDDSVSISSVESDDPPLLPVSKAATESFVPAPKADSKGAVQPPAPISIYTKEADSDSEYESDSSNEAEELKFPVAIKEPVKVQPPQDMETAPKSKAEPLKVETMKAEPLKATIGAEDHDVSMAPSIYGSEHDNIMLALREQLEEVEKKLGSSELDAKIELSDLEKEVEKQRDTLRKKFGKKIDAQRKINEKQDKANQQVVDEERKIVESVREENKALRAQKQRYPKEIAEVVASNQSLKAANEDVAGHFASLNKFAKKLQADQNRLSVSSAKCKDEYLPRYRQELWERQQYIDGETKIKTLYRGCVLKISKRTEKLRLPALYEAISTLVIETEAEVNPKFDPKHLFANDSDSDTSSSSSSSNGDSSDSDSDSD